ncbi:MAG: aminotransferase class IV [Anaerolineales bacterium]
MVLNGALLEDACLPADDRGLLLGDGLFETILAVDGEPFWWPEHWERLARSAAALGFTLPRTDAQAVADVHLALQGAGLAAGRAAVRLTLTRGRGPRGYWPEGIHSPVLLVSATRFAHSQKSLDACTVNDFPRNERSPLCRHKTTSALELVLAQRAVRQRGADVALLLNTRGEWVEAAYANLFVVAGGEVFTPPLDAGALPGVTRARLLTAQVAREALVTAETWAQVQAAFLTNSLMGVRPLAAVDGCPLDVTHPLIRVARQALSLPHTPKDTV